MEVPTSKPRAPGRFLALAVGAALCASSAGLMIAEQMRRADVRAIALEDVYKSCPRAHVSSISAESWGFAPLFEDDDPEDYSPSENISRYRVELDGCEGESAVVVDCQEPLPAPECKRYTPNGCILVF